MTKTANILYKDLTEGDLYLKEDQMNLLLENKFPYFLSASKKLSKNI